MILKYYFNILVYPFVILLLSVSTSIYSHNYKQLYYSSIRIGLILFLLNIVINYFIFNPVSQFLKNEKTSPKLNRRILNLSIYSTISFFIISILYIIVHLYLMGKEYENVFTLEIIMRLINRYTILGTIFTYFIIDNYTISLKEYIYYKNALEIQSREFIYDGVVLKTRVGINTDKVLVGNIGTVNRMEYTVIGDGVNVASRLETLNKKYNTTLLIGENSYEMTKDLFQFEEMGRELLKGKTNFVKVYKIIV